MLVGRKGPEFDSFEERGAMESVSHCHFLVLEEPISS